MTGLKPNLSSKLDKSSKRIQDIENSIKTRMIGRNLIINVLEVQFR